MKKYLLLLLIFSLIVISYGCTQKAEPGQEEKINVSVGYLINKDSENSITIEFDKKEYTLKVEDKTAFDSLMEDELYLVAYNQDMVVKSIETNPALKDLLAQGIQEPDIEPGAKDGEKILPEEKLNVDNLTLLNTYIFDFDMDGTDETISMYTAAQRDSKGEIMWDDGQRWVLVVQDSDKDYVLFDDWVQLGNIRFYVYKIDDDFYIDTIQVGTASLTFKSYYYDKNNDSFVMTVPFTTTGNVIMLHSSSGY